MAIFDFIKYEDEEPLENGSQFIKVIFLKDFGKFKKGDKFDSVFFDLSEGKALAYDDEGNIKQTTSFGLIAE